MTPHSADNRIISRRWLNLSRYQVNTPKTATATHRTYQSGLAWAMLSTPSFKDVCLNDQDIVGHNVPIAPYSNHQGDHLRAMVDLRVELPIQVMIAHSMLQR